VTKSDVSLGAEGLGPLAGDHVQASYTFPSGVVGYFASRREMAGNPSRFAIQVFGSKGIIEMESGYLAPAFILKDSSWSPARSGKNWERITSAGIGKPEPLLGNLSGYWSRRIDDVHRLVYAVDDVELTVIACRGHHK
jgi:hypothetical protein